MEDPVVRLPRLGRKLDPQHGLIYPNAGQPCRPPAGPNPLAKDFMRGGLLYLEIGTDEIGTAVIRNVLHHYDDCSETLGTLAHINVMRDVSGATFLSYLDDCYACFERMHQALQWKINYCRHLQNRIGTDICADCGATNWAAYDKDRRNPFRP